MANFKMTCNSQKCVGNCAAKTVVKSENKFVRDCPDCGSVLYQDFGGNGKPRSKPRANRKANFGLRNHPKEYL